MTNSTSDFTEKYKGKQPFEIFEEWYVEAEKCDGVADHTEMNIATATPDATPRNSR